MVVLDVANVMGSQPDGWWRDRAGAAERRLDEAVAVLARSASTGTGPTRVVAVLEGAARRAHPPVRPGLEVVLAPADGDAAVVAAAEREVARTSTAPVATGGGALVVVTADRGLRARLPVGAVAVGPGWWHALVRDTAPGEAECRGDGRGADGT